MKGLGGDENDGELELKAGQDESEEGSSAVGTPDAGRVERRIDEAEISGDVAGPLFPEMVGGNPVVPHV